mmetsp:Transcript_2973/g.9927  ORF Transcript_2973/g.9927 Transcript_2973/m.9927 type:complete len:311 (-) Transcript_2973:236-1168(-)
MDELVEFSTDVKSKQNLIQRKVSETTFLGMPKMQLQFWKTWEEFSKLANLALSMDPQEITLLDARKRKLDYKSCGFKLHPLKSAVTDWPVAATLGTEQNLLYRSELEKVVRELHPGVIRVAFMAFLLRGGPGENKPAAQSIHLDMYPDQQLYDAWKEKNAGVVAFDDDPSKKDDLAEAFADPNLELKHVLGLWKPRNTKNPVYDHPLFCLDATTLAAEDAVPQYQRFTTIAEGKVVPVVNVAGSVKAAPQQRWYYFPEQTADELFVFRHKTVDDPWLVNFHAAATLPLPEGAETRSSIETRAYCFFAKGK